MVVSHYIFIIQVYDLSLLRDSDGFQVVEPTVLFDGFGSAHNIVGNDDTDFVYAVGSFDTCTGV